jgi:death-on-curing protein
VSEPFWISEDVARAIHADQIAQHGGSLGIRDENLFGASLARPRHLFAYGEPTLFDLAAALRLWFGEKSSLYRWE